MMLVPFNAGRAARNGAEQDKPAYSLRVLQPEALRDHAAGREPHDKRNGHRTGVQHVNHVLHEVFQRQRAVDVS